jgi:serine protease Do
MPLLTRSLACAALLAALLPAAAQMPASTCAGQAPAVAQRGFAAAVARNAPAVVSIVILRPRREPDADLESFGFFQSMSGLPLPHAPAAGTTQERSTSSGFAFSADGYILTSSHAVFDARGIWVIAADGRRWPAALLGVDRATDVAVLKIDAPGFPVAAIAASPRICAGDRVAAMGDPFGFEGSVTAGVISAYPRFLPGGGGMPLIQTDVAINPGSSGGPLFGADGAVIGMNSLIFSASGIYIGVSFALPIDRVLKLAAELRAGASARGEIGLRTQPVSAELAHAFGLDKPRGALVVKVMPGGPADQAGLRIGDIVLSAGRGGWGPTQDVEDVLAAARPGAILHLQLWRQRGLREVAVQVNAVAVDPPKPRERLQHARLGLGLVSRQGAGVPAGAWVETSSGAALLAGIEPGDQIIAVNATHVITPDDFDAALESASGPVVALLVARGSVMLYLPVLRQLD